MGAFIRLYQNGSWYYSSTTSVNALEAEIQKLLVLANNGKTLPNTYSVPANNGIHHLINKTENDFSKITLDKKVKLGESYLPLLSKIKNLQDSRIRYTDLYKEKYKRIII